MKLPKLSSALRALLFAGALLLATVNASADDKLVGRAVLPAKTFSPGPVSGRQLGTAAINGITPPFEAQPVQGISGIVDNHDGTFWVMADNGYGGIENSYDFQLRLYHIRPIFKTGPGASHIDDYDSDDVDSKDDDDDDKDHRSKWNSDRWRSKFRGAGKIRVLGHITLSDPDKKIVWAITNFFTKKRILTGADFDIESIQRVSDSSFWIGDEFGPFLLHFSENGKLLEAPIALPDFDNAGKEIRSPQNPKHEEGSAIRIMNALRSHGEIYNREHKTPVFSPWDPMMEDGDATTFIDNREAPPAGSGLTKASSELFNIPQLKAGGYPVVVYTVNDSPRMTKLMTLGVDGLISDRPDLLYAAVKAFNGGALMLPNGLIDPAKFDAQGHRGGRNLRTENTLPAYEVAMDNLMTTIETDMGITSDDIPMMSHDPAVESLTCRHADGAPYAVANEIFIKDATVAQIQNDYICDKVFRGAPQSNDRNLSPVAVAFATAQKLRDPYVLPTLQNLFDFVKFYVAYYKTGAGKTAANAELRWRNAERIRFNLETKTNPRTDIDPIKNLPFNRRTTDVVSFVASVLRVLNDPLNIAFDGRADIQSFDFRTLLKIHQWAPEIRTVALIGDFPKFANPSVGGSDDSTNLQPGLSEQAGNTPWLAGLPWPYRVTTVQNTFRSQRSGGFEGMALTTDGKRLLPLLERPLTGAPQNALQISEFDIATRKYTGVRYYYPFAARGTNIGDFIMYSDKRGLIIEREGSQGDLNGFKAVFEITLGTAGNNVAKRLAVDLLKITDPNGISLPGEPGDVGIGPNFAFPFTTIESVFVVDDSTLGVLNDNNFPFSLGRHLGTGAPDDNEFILIKLGTPLTK